MLKKQKDFRIVKIVKAWITKLRLLAITDNL